MPQTSAFAYTLSQMEDGWRWSVFDEDGAVVAAGARANQSQAQAAIESILRTGRRDAAA